MLSRSMCWWSVTGKGLLNLRLDYTGKIGSLKESSNKKFFSPSIKENNNWLAIKTYYNILQITDINLARPLLWNTNEPVGFAITVLNIQRYKLRAKWG